MRILIFGLLYISGFALANPDDSGLFMHLGNAGESRTFYWDHGGKRQLAAKPSLPMSEFKKAYIKEFIKHNGGYHKILIEYTKSGRTTFKKLANEDRDRSFCFVLKGIILSCRGLPPSHKGLYLKGISIAKNSKSEAQRIVDDINKLIKSEHPTK